MINVYLGLGSNINRHQHIAAALDALHEKFGELKISTVYESKSVGFNGSNFFNLVVGVNTDLTVPGRWISIFLPTAVLWDVSMASACRGPRSPRMRLCSCL
jgi:7,8-dihydro-6-hydroxymethylpterin-pyrophosphokinase